MHSPASAVRVDPGPAPPPEARRPLRGTALRWVLLTVGVLALAVRLGSVLHSGGLGGLDGYDDGVYYASAASFVSGRLPYRDFLLLHPPGLMLVLTPFAGLGRLTTDRTGFEAARVFVMVVGAANAVLVTFLARRLGLAAAASAGAFCALWTSTIPTETTIRLEPLVTLGLLVGLAALWPDGRRRTTRTLYAAGLALGFAMSVKIWAVVLVAGIAVWCWRWWGRRGLLATLAGVVSSCLLLNGPFWLAAPGAMWRMVVADQLGRGHTPANAASRLTRTLVPGVDAAGNGNLGVWPAVLAGVVAVAMVLLCRRTGDGRVFLSLLAVAVAVLLLSPSFYAYYPALAAPFLALVVGGVVGAVGGPAPLRARSPRGSAAGPGGRRVARTAPAVVLLAVLATLGGAAVLDARQVVSDRFPADALARVALTARCVTSDSPDALLLTNAFTRNLERGCRAPVDLSGLTYDRFALTRRVDGSGVPRADNVAWLQHLMRYLLSGQTVFLLRPQPDGLDLTPSTARVLTLRASGTGWAMFSHRLVGTPATGLGVRGV